MRTCVNWSSYERLSIFIVKVVESMKLYDIVRCYRYIISDVRQFFFFEFKTTTVHTSKVSIQPDRRNLSIKLNETMIELRPIESSQLTAVICIKFHCSRSIIDETGGKYKIKLEKEEQLHSVGFGTRFDYLFPILSKRSTAWSYLMAVPLLSVPYEPSSFAINGTRICVC